MTPWAIAGMQLHLTPGVNNLPLIRLRLDTLMSVYPWVQMVVLSELAAHGPGLQHAEPMPGPTEAAFCEMAKAHGVWLIPGSLFEKSESHIYNTASVIDPRGDVVARYRKLFPFHPYERGVEAGDAFVVFDVPDVGRFGLSICYDLWFPETTRTLAAMGAEVIIHPVYTSTVDRELELVMARAAAIQNQVYVVDINGAGGGGYGRSLFVGPEGDIIHQAGTTVELMPIEIDLDRVRRTRENGVRGLGQPLKGFRDSKVQFRIYSDQPDPNGYLATLGPLEKPARGSRSGHVPTATKLGGHS